jgi:hypothetical protein
MRRHSGKTVVASPFQLAETEVTGELWFAVCAGAKKDGFSLFEKAYCGRTDDARRG